MKKENKWLAHIRDLKMSILSGERHFEITERRMQRFAAELRLIAREFPGDTITGSLALNLYGAIDRGIADIDIIIPDRARYSQLDYSIGMLYRVPMEGEKAMKERLGVIEFKESRSLLQRILRPGKTRRHKVDFFECREGKPTREFEFEGRKYRAEDPVSILETKCVLETASLPGLSKEKHERDLLAAFGIGHDDEVVL